MQPCRRSFHLIRVFSSFCFVSSDQPFPADFRKRVCNIFKRLFRVYAHIYCSHFPKVVALGAEAHMNTCFRHFVYFVQEFHLIEPQEMEPLRDLIASLAKQ